MWGDEKPHDAPRRQSPPVRRPPGSRDLREGTFVTPRPSPQIAPWVPGDEEGLSAPVNLEVGLNVHECLDGFIGTWLGPQRQSVVADAVLDDEVVSRHEQPGIGTEHIERVVVGMGAILDDCDRFLLGDQLRDLLERLACISLDEGDPGMGSHPLPHASTRNVQPDEPPVPHHAAYVSQSQGAAATVIADLDYDMGLRFENDLLIDSERVS